MFNSIGNQKGIALGYVFGLVALLAILGAMLAQNSDVKQSAVLQKRLADTLVAQSFMIRNALFLCQVSYPSGGATGGTDNRFPATTTNFRNVVCPGAGTVKVFSGISDVMYPKKIDGFTEWSLTNDINGVFITTSIEAASDSNRSEAIRIASGELGAWQSTSTASSLTYYLKK